MIERFNFYDIYGYFIPGLVLAGMIWLPFGLIHGLPTQDFSSTLMVILFAYVAGHLLQGFGAMLPLTGKDQAGHDRQHSDLLLDSTDDTFTQATKDQISKLSLKFFHLDLATSPSPVALTEEERKRIAHLRNVAFFQARSLLIQDRRQAYSEQFQGLYAVMRGVTLAFAAAAAYFLGWAVAYGDKTAGKMVGWAPPILLALVATSFVLAFILSVKTKGSNSPAAGTKVLAACVALAIFCAAALIAQNVSPGNESHLGDSALLLIALVSGVASFRCYGAYRNFSREFAVAVWREFSNFDVVVPAPAVRMLPPPNSGAKSPDAV